MTTPPRSTLLTGLLGLVRRHPTTAFFTLAYGLSWTFWLPYVLSANGLGLLALHFPGGPLVSQLLGLGLGAYLGPLTAAFSVTALVEGRPGLRRWVHRLTHWRVGWRWYVAVLTGVPAVMLLATAALPGALDGARMVSATTLAVYVPMLVLQVLTTATAEEPGWRDFALPRLQRRLGPVLGTVVLGVLWGCWHLPLFLTDWAGPGQHWSDVALFVAACVPLSLVMTWVFNRSGQSVPLVMVLHASINTFCSLIWFDAFPSLDPAHDTAKTLLIGAAGVALVLLVATRGRLGLQTTHQGAQTNATTPTTTPSTTTPTHKQTPESIASSVTSA